MGDCISEDKRIRLDRLRQIAWHAIWLDFAAVICQKYIRVPMLVFVCQI